MFTLTHYQIFIPRTRNVNVTLENLFASNTGYHFDIWQRRQETINYHRTIMSRTFGSYSIAIIVTDSIQCWHCPRAGH